jgi:hypothetical protein
LETIVFSSLAPTGGEQGLGLGMILKGKTLKTKKVPKFSLKHPKTC